ncbi:MAG: 2-hydroxy-3-oxopropionate reductase [Alphaproteobacteria bacterium]|nr:2-hydroxy-3-oxopropionate reductase [Alphaproteobacteria bacterium]MBT4965962.1 2-hydroxy-3-oxopropionate reductase [Alphaproteobacteria bacterium]MBT5160499.1 2-hydroxy-3-oxopropionate reductase [Alphaproteobacteria bacterium]MBT5919667.1 2-hydroxy-3-oxopropionate reductase [Alphaproteobacteria bacterium]MBT6387734.1 2-hydroxy-3-oxopropionate reductase [Alphaproteobacteria bacterium]
MKIGFIGLGLMGQPMAGHLLKAGYELHVHDVVAASKQALVDLGAVECIDNKAVAEASDIIITMVPDTPDVQAALFSDDGVAAGLSPGKIVVDMSSISPTATTGFAERIEALGCFYLDAPVSGGPFGAINAALTIMVGGPQETFDKVLPVFEAMGKTVTLIGNRNGDGQVAKVANQIIVGITVEAVAEALLFASKAGADPQIVRQALMGGAANSIILENHGGRMLDRNFEPGFRAELQQKDLNLAMQSARELGLFLPAASAAHDMYNATRANGMDKDDHTSVLRVLESMANHQTSDGKKS